jgi:hypothetical protein
MTVNQVTRCDGETFIRLGRHDMLIPVSRRRRNPR